MTPDRWSKLRLLVEDALLLPVEERCEFLQQNICDPVEVAEALRLVSYDEQADAIFAIQGWQAIAERPSLAGNARIGRSKSFANLAGAAWARFIWPNAQTVRTNKA